MALLRRKKVDTKALFEQEAAPYLDNLYAAALRLTRSPSDAEDLVQDTLLRAYRFYDRFEAGTNFKAWLLKIQTNMFLNRYRRSVRERDTLEGAAGQPVGEGVMSRAAMRTLTDPAGEAQRRLIAAEISKALDELSDDARVMIVLADVEGLAYREIADILACPIGTVMSRLHRARKTLQVRLLAQAVEMGIVEEEDQELPQPLSMDAFRKRRGEA